MADEPSSESKDQATEAPAPEVLKPQADENAPETAEPETSTPASQAATPGATAATPPAADKRPRRGMYRPSHKGTFIGLAVVVAILAVNAAVITFVIKGQAKDKDKASEGQVTISQGVLDKLGVNRSAVGNAGVELIVNPDARFKGKLQIGSDVSIAGQLKLNSKFSATDASLAKLEAGDTSLSQLNVNGNGTISTLTLRNELTVTGTTRLQGDVTLGRLLTVNNSANISGNLAVGGTMSVNRFQTSSVVSDGNITLGGHFITRGSAPRVGPGTALGSNGTVSISGNDAAGTIAANIGTGASAGIVANVAFITQYSNTPHVVVTAVGPGAGSVYVNRNAAGFSVGVNGPMAPGGYAFDYIVMQ